MASPRPIPAHNLKSTATGLRRRSFLWRWRRPFFLLALVMFTSVAGAGLVVSRIELPAPPPVDDQTTFICGIAIQPGQCGAANAMAELHGEEDRTSVQLDQVPKVMIDAVLAAEDRDFFEHGGVDPNGIGRAAWSDIRGGGARQGGSTITQQYVKNVYLTSDRTLTRKVREAVISVKLEKEMSKSEILESYLNTIYFGRGAYGVGAAARAYWGKDIEAVTLPEAALLAGLIRSPQRAEPYLYPEEARRRRHTVLQAMVEEGKITGSERDRSDAVPFNDENGLQLWAASDGIEVDGQVSQVGGQYFVEYVRKELARRYGDDAVFGGGLRVYTTLDLNAQRSAYEAVHQTLNAPGDPSGALVAIDDQGKVRAMVGGRDYTASKVNLATGRNGGGSGRQPGSTFKAFALAEAVREGYSTESLIPTPSSAIFEEANGGEDWRVKGGCCGGQATLIEATAESSNTGYAALMLRLGAARVAQMARDLGVSSAFENPYPSLVLGSGEVSVLDMAAAYSTFSNQGTRIAPVVITRVERADGTLIEDFTPRRTQVLTPDQATTVTNALQRVVETGTGKAAKFGKPVAGKTGTTQNNRDAWFAGYTPRLTAVTWMGYPDNRPMVDVHGQTVAGGNLPALMWRAFMDRYTANTDTGTFPQPTNLDEGAELFPDLEAPPPTSPSRRRGTGTSSDGGSSDGGSSGTQPDDTASDPDPPPGSTAPEATEPAPAPTEPAPTEPAPTEPAPTEPAPTDPAPAEPSVPPDGGGAGPSG